jgi:hypothetical protein
MIASHKVVYVSFIPARRLWQARNENLRAITAGSLHELRTKLAAACPNTKIAFALSRAARAEMARRRNGGAPVQVGWT